MTQLPEGWLKIEDASEKLGCGVQVLQSMTGNGLLSQMVRKESQFVRASEVEALGRVCRYPRGTHIRPEMIEVGAALAAIALAIAALLPDMQSTQPVLASVTASLSALFAAYSSFGTLWLVAAFCCEEEDPANPKVILKLLGDPKDHAMYWLIALCLCFLLLLSVFVFALILSA